MVTQGRRWVPTAAAASAPGLPDHFDDLVAATFPALTPIPDPRLGPRKVDVGTRYNTERYRPRYADQRVLPIFLSRSSPAKPDVA